MARGRSGAEREMLKRATGAKVQQKIGTERSMSINSRNRAVNEMYEKQRTAKKKGMFEGNWMTALGTILAIVAVSAVTGGFGGAALCSAGSASAAGAGSLASGWLGALAIGGTAALGTAGGMHIADKWKVAGLGQDVEGAYAEASEVDKSKLHRATIGSGYDTLFDPVTNLSRSIEQAGEDYEFARKGSYTYKPLTAGVSMGAMKAI